MKDKHSEHTDKYKAYNIEGNLPEKKNESSSTFLRKHNHEFGDPNTYFSSLYKQDYGPNEIPKNLSKNELRENAIALRKTNMKLGDDPTDYTSMQNLQFANLQPKSIVKSVNLNLGQSNVRLGNDLNDFQTISQLNYHEKPESKNILNTALLKDLRGK